MAEPVRSRRRADGRGHARAGLGGDGPAGTGMDGWFMGTTEIEPRLGGAVRTALPGFTMKSTVTAWDSLRPVSRTPHRSGRTAA